MDSSSTKRSVSDKKQSGRSYKKGDVLAKISDPFGRDEQSIIANESGILVGATLLPLVNQGDAMFHMAVFHDSARVSNAIEDSDFM